METRILSGTRIAQQVRSDVREEIRSLTENGARAPKLSVVLVGTDPASEVYVRNKSKACEKDGILNETIRLSESTSEEELAEVIMKLNEDTTVDGILVQLPLPAHLNEEKMTQMVSPLKDVDGFHITNVGMLSTGSGEGFVSCTPVGMMEILHRSNISVEGKHVVIVGRSNIVGKPAALLALQENATVTICHSRTKNLKEMTKQADILMVAVGKAKMIDGSMIKEGAVVIDAGINRTESGLVGDVDYDSCLGIAGAVTPVPGGVGPMTIAMLMENTLKAYKMHRENEA